MCVYFVCVCVRALAKLLYILRGLFSIGLPVLILKALQPFQILAVYLAHLNFLDKIFITTLGERYKLYLKTRKML